ncbi:MAG: flagellar assembly protein T N-terminal domain-containing protein [Deltaproteobacteria bacterium]|nr:flagellar assembly protein T N-terminal domain-containing protein [Deltaproteobacteria bacterium]
MLLQKVKKHVIARLLHLARNYHMMNSLRVHHGSYHMKWTIFIILLCLAFPLSGHASTLVEANGMAPIEADISLSRDIAILRAKQAAIEQAGVGLTCDTITNMGLLLDNVIKVQTFALVKNYEVISEVHEDNYIKVKIRAWVVEKKNETKEMENVFSHCSVLIGANGYGSDMIQKELVKQMTAKGYFVLDSTFKGWNPEYRLTIDTSMDLSEKNNGIESYFVECSLKFMQRQTGKILIAENEPENNRIFGFNRTKALKSRGPNGFPRKIVQPVSIGFMKKLDEMAKVKEHNVEIAVSGFSDYQTFRQDFVQMVQNYCLGVKAVSNERYEGGIGLISVRYSEKTDYLAAMIGFRSQYRVEQVTDNKIKAVYMAGK